MRGANLLRARRTGTIGIQSVIRELIHVCFAVWRFGMRSLGTSAPLLGRAMTSCSSSTEVLAGSGRQRTARSILSCGAWRRRGWSRAPRRGLGRDWRSASTPLAQALMIVGWTAGPPGTDRTEIPSVSADVLIRGHRCDSTASRGAPRAFRPASHAVAQDSRPHALTPARAGGAAAGGAPSDSAGADTHVRTSRSGDIARAETEIERADAALARLDEHERAGGRTATALAPPRRRSRRWALPRSWRPGASQTVLGVARTAPVRLNAPRARPRWRGLPRAEALLVGCPAR